MMRREGDTTTTRNDTPRSRRVGDTMTARRSWDTATRKERNTMRRA